MACDRRCSRGALSGNTPARMKCGDAWPASSVTRRKGRGGACSERSRAEESTFQAAAAVTFPTRRVRHGTCACLRQQPGGNAAAEQRCRHARRTAPRLVPASTPHAGGAHPIASRSRPRVSPSAARFGIVHSVGNAARMQAQRRYASPRGTAPSTSSGRRKGASTSHCLHHYRCATAAFACRLALARNCTFPACHAQRPLCTVQPGTDANKDRQGAHGSMGF